MPRKATSGTRHGNGQEQGAGWGGPARGAGTGGAAAAFTADSKTRHRRPGGAGDPVKMEERRHQKQIDAENAQLLKNHLLTLATKAEAEIVQVRATEAWLNRHEGMPVARNINLNTDDVRDLTDAAIIAELASLGGTPTDLAEGIAPSSVPGKSPGVVH